MTTREFTIDELDALTDGTTQGPWLRPGGRGATHTAHVYAADCVVHSMPLPLDPGLPDCHNRWRADARLIAAAPDLAAFARRLLVERDATRAALVRLGAAYGITHADTDAANPDPVIVVDAATRSLTDAWARCRAATAEREALRATVDRLRPVVNGDGLRIADETIDDAIDVCEDADELADYLAAKGAIRALRALLADAPAEVPATERRRPALVWNLGGRRSVLRLGSHEIGSVWDDGSGHLLADRLASGATDMRSGRAALRNAALAAGFDVPEVPDVG